MQEDEVVEVQQDPDGRWSARCERDSGTVGRGATPDEARRAFHWLKSTGISRRPTSDWGIRSKLSSWRP